MIYQTFVFVDKVAMSLHADFFDVIYSCISRDFLIHFHRFLFLLFCLSYFEDLIMLRVRQCGNYCQNSTYTELLVDGFSFNDITNLYN